MNTIRLSRSEASAVIYDSVQVQLIAEADGIRITTRTTLPRLPMIARNEVVAPPLVADILREVDADARAELPGRFTAAFDQWGRRGYPLEAMTNLGRTAGSPLAPAQIGAGIVDFWKESASDVRVDEAQSSISALLHGCIPISFSLGFPHGELNGAIVTEVGPTASCFGTWLLADYPDLTGFTRVSELIDTWVRLRIDAPPR